jgi:hypothetical protein
LLHFKTTDGVAALLNRFAVSQKISPRPTWNCHPSQSLCATMALTAGLENTLLIEHIVVFYVINFILLEDSTWSGKDARWGRGE